MAGVYAVRRVTKAGDTRWLVRVSRGRYQPELHLGSFRTTRERDARIAWARAELAAGREPTRSGPARSVEQRFMPVVCAEWLAGRRDLADATLKVFPPRLARIAAHWPRTPPSGVTTADVDAWIDTLVAEDLAASTVRRHVKLLAQLLDHEDVQPNPARSRRLRMPRAARKAKRLPTSHALDTVCAAVPPLVARAVRLVEVSGMRVSEALALRWQDIDERAGVIAVQDSKTASGVRLIRRLYTTERRALVDCTAERLPVRPEDVDPISRVLAGVDQGSVYNAIRAACDATGAPAFSMHDCRHLHASRMLHAGMSPAELAARLGHASPQITLSTYAHVLPPS